MYVLLGSIILQTIITSVSLEQMGIPCYNLILKNQEQLITNP